MAFRGLFIGIDRYELPDINELGCARRDATALEAVFTDTLGGASILLVNEEATRARIEAEFAALDGCSPDDTVVIGFSGHGSETHELVAHDTQVHDLRLTAIHLDQVQQWFAHIPARRVVLFLDCCFSGGIGAKVLQVDAKPRDLSSVGAQLDQLAGDGRLIFTASSANEPAYEHNRFGHGFLTYYLLEALCGAEEVMSAGRLSVYRLLEYVTKRVKSAAEQIGRPQNPTLRGTLDGDLAWPVFIRGPRFAAAFPERMPVAITADIRSLAGAGFPAGLLQAWAGTIPSLNPLQLTAINEFAVLDGNHLVVSAPTSSGKTMVGELAALRNVVDGRRAIFLLPLKALVSDKRRHFQTVYGPYGVRIVEATGETDDITPLIRGRYDIALLTYEKFASVALSNPHVLRQSGVIVIDEAQMLADANRGANLEFLLTLIRMQRRQGIEPQTIALSAVIGDTNGLEEWLGGRLLRREERPVPLDEGLLLGGGRFRYLDAASREERVSGPLFQPLYHKGSSQDWIIPLVQKLVGEGQQVIVFRETKGEARGCANYLASALGLRPAADALARLPAADPSQASNDLRAALEHGVAFHNADLFPEERRVIEEEFRKADAQIRVIAATTTLAMGVNTPASSVVIAGLDHPGDEPYSVAEYKNLVGRAGRMGFAEKGTSYLLATDGRAEHDFWHRYVLGAPENLKSRFLDQGTDPRTLIVRVLVTIQRISGKGVSADEIVAFLESSFGAFQAARAHRGWRWNHDDLRAALDDLRQHRLVEQDGENAFHLTDLGRLAGESTTEVGTVLRFVDCLGPLQPGEISDPALITVTQTAIELDQVLFPLNKKSTRKEPAFWPNELRIQGVPGHLLGSLARYAADGHQATLRAKKAVACLLFVSGRPMIEIERIVGQFGGAFDGAAGPIRAVAGRTCDVLPTAARVAEILHPTLNLEDRIGQLAIRLTLGIPGPAVDLGREAGSELLRGDYCELVDAGVADPEAVAKADDGQLLACLGASRQKLAIVREVAEKALKRRAQAAVVAGPVLKPYAA